MASEPIRVLIADDHPVVRRGLKVLLGTQPDLTVVGEASDGQEAVAIAESVGHDVILMDLVMPGMDGVEATRRILEKLPPTRVLVLTNYGSDRKLFPALDAGALGFLLKDSTGEELVQAIRQVAKGMSALSPPIARRLVSKVAREKPDAPGEPLTPREVEVLQAMADGHSNEELADKLCISPATIRTHISHILAKLSVTSRTQAVLYALKHRIATLEKDQPR